MAIPSRYHLQKGIVSAGIGALKRIRSLVPHQTLLRMYEALVAPYFDYCSEVWGCLGIKACVTDSSRDCKMGLGELSHLVIIIQDLRTFSKT